MVSANDVLNELERIIDPEFGLDIVNMGLVYDVNIFPDTGGVAIEMTLTTPGCPLGDSITRAAKELVGQLDGVKQVVIDLTFMPQWDPSMITPYGKAQMRIR